MKFLYLLLAGIMSVSPDEKTDWTMRVNEDGVSVYTRDVANSDIDECRAVTTLANTSLRKVLDILLDVNNYPSLFPDCFKAEILVQNGKYYDIHYYAMKAPWPVKDRDAIYESTTTLSGDGKQALVTLKCKADYREEEKNFVRIKKGDASWELEETNPNTIRVTYRFLVDPGGGIPAWLINSAIVSNPLKTMHNLQKKVKIP
jgi:ribosome-associated toxin RatA of RatAB toxin-antitoxin module